MTDRAPKAPMYFRVASGSRDPHVAKSKYGTYHVEICIVDYFYITIVMELAKLQRLYPCILPSAR